MEHASWHFFIPLETALPVPDGYCSIKHSTGLVSVSGGTQYEPRPDAVFFKFSHETVLTSPFPGIEAVEKAVNKRKVRSANEIEEETRFPDQLVVSVVEIAISKKYVSMAERPDSQDDNISGAFDHALESLNIWLQALSMVAGKPIPSVRREALPPVSLVCSGLFEPWELNGDSLPRVSPERVFMLNHNIPDIGSAPEPAERLDGWMDAALASVAIPGPFSVANRLKVEAEYFRISQGNYQVSVILYAASCESFLNELLLHLLWEDNNRPEDTLGYFVNTGRKGKNGKWRNRGITDVVINYLLPLLTSYSDGQDLPGPVVAWSEKIAKLRNSIVHGAHYPSVEEMSACVDAYSGLMDYICECIFVVRDRFKFTALSILGEKGLVDGGVWDEFSHLEKSLEDVYVRYRAFRRWSDHATNIHRGLVKIGETADAESGKLLLVEVEGYEERVYAVHSDGVFAAEVPLDLYVESAVYKRLKAFTEDEIKMDQTVKSSFELGGYELPSGAKWNLYAYDVIPGPPVMFDEFYKSDNDR